MHVRAYFPVPRDGVKTETFSPQNDRTTELNINFLLTTTVHYCWIQHIILYSRKIWRRIKFGSLAVYITTAKLKSAKISYSHIYVWRSRTEPPNLNPPIFSISCSTAKFNARQYFRLYGTVSEYSWTPRILGPRGPKPQGYLDPRSIRNEA